MHYVTKSRQQSKACLREGDAGGLVWPAALPAQLHQATVAAQRLDKHPPPCSGRVWKVVALEAWASAPASNVKCHHGASHKGRATPPLPPPTITAAGQPQASARCITPTPTFRQQHCAAAVDVAGADGGCVLIGHWRRQQAVVARLQGVEGHLQGASVMERFTRGPSCLGTGWVAARSARRERVKSWRQHTLLPLTAARWRGPSASASGSVRSRTAEGSCWDCRSTTVTSAAKGQVGQGAELGEAPGAAAMLHACSLPCCAACTVLQGRNV